MKKISFLSLLMAMMLLLGCGTTEISFGDVTTTGDAQTTTDTTINSNSTTTANGVVITTTASKASANHHNSTSSQKTTTTTEFVIQSTVTTFKRVNPERSAKETAELINNRLSSPATKIASEKSMVWDPQNEGDWKMSQHASVAVLNGKVYVTWSNARVHEDDCGQRIMYSYTSDFKTWSKPKVLPGGETEIGQYAEVVKMNGFMHSYNGTLYSSFSSSEWLPENMLGPNTRPQGDAPRVNNKLYLVSTKDGVNWKKEEGGSALSSMGTMVTNRFFNIGSSSTIPYTDDPTGLTGWQSASISSSFENIKKEYGISLICEGSYYQTADGIIRAMWRTDCNYILMSESYNNGVTFTRPYMTKFTNGYSMFKFGYLPDNRIFCIYNPTGRDRLPLSIVLSEDGINFTKEYTIRDEPFTMKYSGIGKGGHYSYPTYCIDGDYMYIAYVLQKEAVEVTRIKISDLK